MAELLSAVRRRLRLRLRGRYRVFYNRLTCYLYDAWRGRATMNWMRHSTRYERTAAELFFWYHKLEKGMCLPEPRRFFGVDAARETCHFLSRWESLGFPQSDPVYIGAIETLASYRQIVAALPNEDRRRDELLNAIDRAIDARPRSPLLSTPVLFAPTVLDIEGLERLAEARRSVRNFDGQQVPLELVERAARVAQLSPSACNRQSTRLHVFTEPDKVQALLKLQNGNSGFNHTIPMLVLVTGDSSCFQDASERSQLHLDSGLFLMSFLYGLQSQGLSSCCLNWAVTPERDRKAMALAQIPSSEWIVTFLAVGWARPQALVPRSPRRDVEYVVVSHDDSPDSVEVTNFA